MKTLPSGLLQQAADRLREEFHPEQIYLFGSHAWGNPHDDSDVDLLVIVPDSEERAVRRMQRAHRCLGDLDFAKDVIVQTRAEFDSCRDIPASLQYRVLRDGMKLHG